MHALGISNSTMSNHRQLLRKTFLREMVDDMQDLDILLRRNFPALDTHCLSFEVESYAAKGKSGAKFRFTINDGGRRDAAVLITTAVQRVKTLHERIGHLGTPGRNFLINEEFMPAANPRDALRIYLALHRPDLFGKENPEKGVSFTVSEICPVSIADALS